MPIMKFLIIPTLFSVLSVGLQAQENREVKKHNKLPKPLSKVQKLAEGFRFTEGPAWSRKKEALYFSDIPNKTLHRWKATKGVTKIRIGKQASNGIYIDAQDRIVFCEVGGCRILRIEKPGKETVLADRVKEQLLGHTNDLWIAPDGGIYFSVPNKAKKIPRLKKEGRLMGTVVYIPPKGKATQDVGKNIQIRGPNGVVGSSDGKRLYFTDRGRCWMAKIKANAELENKKIAAPKGSDGLALDEHGNLYTTSKEGIEVFNQSASRILMIPVPETPSNVCFGGKNGRTLFITARTGLYQVEMNVKGDGF